MSAKDPREQALIVELGGLDMAMSIDPSNHRLLLKYETAKTYLNSYKELKTVTNKAESSNPRLDESKKRLGSYGQGTTNDLDESIEDKIKRNQKEALEKKAQLSAPVLTRKRVTTRHTEAVGSSANNAELAMNSIRSRLNIK